MSNEMTWSLVLGQMTYGYIRSSVKHLSGQTVMGFGLTKNIGFSGRRNTQVLRVILKETYSVEKKPSSSLVAPSFMFYFYQLKWFIG
jgi:hypothetical protein